MLTLEQRVVTTNRADTDAFLAKHGLVLKPITKVAQVGEQDVFDLTVPGEGTDLPNSFIANGIVTHNSATPEYIENIMRNMGAKADVKSIFGVRDEKTGKYIVVPRVRYKSEGVAEKFFDYVAKIQRMLPDKKKIGDNWYYIYEDTKENRAVVGKNYDVNYWRKTKRLRVPAKDGSLQCLILVDSYPAMLPETQDVDDPNNAIATQARMFSDQLKRVKGKMKGKRMAVLGINQLRLRPMVAYGSPEYEPCGEALKLYCFGENTNLFTEHGLVSAKEMQYLPLVKTLGERGPEQPSAYEYMGHSQLITVDTSLGFSLSAKPDHRLKVIHTGKNAFVPTWSKLSDLTNQGSRQTYVPVCFGSNFWPELGQALDFSYASRCNNEVIELDFPKVVTPDLAKLLGYWTSEGHIRDGHCIFTNFHDDDVMQDFADTFARVFGLKKKVARNYIVGTEFRIYSMALYQFLCYVGAGNKSAHEKDIPWVVRRSSKACVVAFLQALFEGDGHLGKKGVFYGSASRALIDQVQLMLLNFGILARSDISKRKWNTVERELHVLSLSGADALCFVQTIGFLSERKISKYSSMTAGNGANRMTRDALPDLTNTRMRPKMRELIATAKGRCKHYRTAMFTDAWFEFAHAEVAKYRTSHERDAATSVLDSLKSFIDYTVSNGVVWVPVTQIRRNTEYQPTFDFNMPDTSTVVTNGIVSHNSDVRLKWSANALSSVSKDIGEKIVGKGQIEEESSIMMKHGTDNYRYIKVRGHKNKLSRPYLECWLRLWITDAKGDAQGFDPVFDTYMYLLSTGQVEGKRAKMRLKFKGNEASRSMSWMDFKRLILGDRSTVKAICQDIGMKPVVLRDKCFAQMAAGTGIELYNNHAVVKRASKAERRAEDADSETADGEDDND